MESVFYNAERAKEEEKEKETLYIEAEKRNEYFKRLGKDKRFLKYILEEIIDVEIKANTDLTGDLAGFITATPEQVKAIMIGKSAAKKTSENIKIKIVSNF